MKLKVRNFLTAYFFGKYDVRKIASGLLIKDEEFVSSFENIYYNEMLIFGSIFLGFLGIALSLFSVYFLSLVLVGIIAIFFALELEIVFLSSERLFVEIRGIPEKLLKTRNVKSVSLEQIAILQYKRSPVNRPGLVFSALILLTGGVLISIVPSITITTLSVILFVLGGYFFVFSLRLNKRSIELSIIGVTQPIGIGRKKGAPIYFLNELQNLVFERIHHYEMNSGVPNAERILTEFPLSYPSWLKEIIENRSSGTEMHVIRLLFEESCNFNRLAERSPNIERSNLEQALRKLKEEGIVYFSSETKTWIVNEKL